MATKGKTKISVSKISQERALEFDKKYRTSPTLKNDLKALRKEFTNKEDLYFQTWPSDVPVYSESQECEIKEMCSSQIAQLNDPILFTDKISNLMEQYSFSREWRSHFVLLVLTGYYSVPDTNYFLDYNENYPSSVSIVIGKHTTSRDITKAHKEAQKLLPREDKKSHGSAKAYSWINDPHTVDLLKEITLPFLHKKKLNTEEMYIYDNSKDLQTASDEILKRRTKFRSAGERTKTGRPKFIKKVSDEEYFSLIESKKNAKTLKENLKKVRAKHKKAL
jgi:hypothetical protein